MLEHILSLQHRTERIRNISIVAHVDHGKTTLTDQLISCNNIISKKLAGNLRYMDSRADEQLRGITMKSSSITIVYDNHLINLIDSPGHVEFSSEVQAALRLTDGALILVDCLEGFSSQTYTVLKQMFEEGLRGILVLNKIDRLVLEKQLDPENAYIHMSQIIDQVNATISSFLNEQYVEQTTNSEFSLEPDQAQQSIETLENTLYFSPEKNNVVFCSALDSWAFTISKFAQIFSEKLKWNQAVLQKCLWGNYYVKGKRVFSKPTKEGQSPLFVDFVLRNIWSIYQNSTNVPRLQQIAQQLNISGPINSSKALLSRWLPLDQVIFKSVLQCLPNPQEAQKTRMNIISKKLQRQIDKSHDAQFVKLHQAIEKCDPNGPVVVFVAKMVNITPDCIDEKGQKPLQDGVASYAFARVFSGTLRRGQRLFVIGPKSKIITTQEQVDQTDINEFQVNRIYLMMAQYLEAVQEIPAGNLVSIGSLDDLVFKTATISSTHLCPSLTPVQLKYKSILKTTVMPVNLDDQPRLVMAIKRLYKSDPSLDVTTLEQGELVLGTCGNVHLERCINDIEKMTGIKVKISEPIIPYKETITYKDLVKQSNEKYNNKKSKLLQQDKQKKQKQQFENTKTKDGDVELQRQQEIKKKILESEDSEIVKDTNELDHEDLRYNQIKDEEQKFKYSQKQEVKKIDHKNRGKNTNKGNLLLGLQDKSNLVEEFTANQKISVSVRAIGIPFEFAIWLENNQKMLRRIFYEEKHKGDVEGFLDQLDEARKQCKLDKKLNELIENHLFCFGPKKCGPNLLIYKGLKKEDSVIQKLRNQVLEKHLARQKEQAQKPLQQEPLQDFQNFNEAQQNLEEGQLIKQEQQTEVEGNDQFHYRQMQPPQPPDQERIESTKDSKSQLSDTASSIAKGLELYLNQQELSSDAMMNALAIGFDMALGAGPLCAEPMIGACFIIEGIKLMEEDLPQIAQDMYGPIQGQLISMMKDACLNSFLGANARLVESVYRGTLHTDFENYGKVLNVINQRRGRILSEILNNSTNLFSLSAHIPLSCSQDFYSALQTATHGHISAQLDFDGWIVNEEDPFYQPYTDDDIEENGIQQQIKNVARDQIMATRKRKGMYYEEKIVVAADKQRNLSKKK